jgi:putative membrane protein
VIGRVVAYIVGSMIAVLAVGTIFQDRFVTYDSEVAVLTFGVVLGILTAYVKPALKFISLPLTCLTFGLFAIVINAVLFGAAARITPGMSVTLWGAIVGSVFASITNGIVYSVVDED